MKEPKTPFSVGGIYETEGRWSANVVYRHKDRFLTVQHRNDGAVLPIWVDLSGVYSDESRGYNLVPPDLPKNRVQLTAADVPPGSVVRVIGTTIWEMVNSVDECALYTGTRAAYFGEPSETTDYLEIKRPGEDWKPMWKES